MIRIEPSRGTVRIYFPATSVQEGHTLFVAISTDPASGCAVVPFAKNEEGSTVFLPFRANAVFSIRIVAGGAELRARCYEGTQWGQGAAVTDEFCFESIGGDALLAFPISAGASVRLVAYVKDMRVNDGWGSVLQDEDFGAIGGWGDRYLARFAQLADGSPASFHNRLGDERIRVYQLLPRLFGNTNPTRKPNGTLAENGCGRFSDIDNTALAAIRDLGITHVWLTGVLQQATASDYSEIGAPADDPDLLKGLAGSPYAIKDYFDVSPDYADEPAQRLEEFRALLDRVHQLGMRAVIDFVPNHVARCYGSDVLPELSFGRHDDRSKFFDPQNNFYYLHPDDHGHGPPLRLPSVSDGKAVSPTCQVLGTCDGIFDGERTHGCVTGNNVISWSPSLNDWYETVKLNYGFNFTTGDREYPHGIHAAKSIPDTWLKMDRIIAYWQEFGVAGFRCDMAHMVPPEFWSWLIGRARTRQPDVFFMAEAYDNDPAKVPAGDPLFHALADHRGNVMFDLLSAGFDAVYDDPSYKKLKAVYDGGGWANDVEDGQPHDFIFHNSLRYAENHDEVRLAGRNHWGGVGMNVGRVVASILYGMGRGPVMLYHGQEVGEPADGVEGFSGDDARSTIFDYWCMPEFAKWVNGHRYDGGQLSKEQAELREFYRRLLHVVGEQAFVTGEYYPLNPHNVNNPRFGPLPGESASGHWLHAFARFNAQQRFVIVSNLHPRESIRDVRVRIPGDLLEAWHVTATSQVSAEDRLNGLASASFTVGGAYCSDEGLPVIDIPPLTSIYLAITVSDAR
jgi:glycosidase